MLQFFLNLSDLLLRMNEHGMKYSMPLLAIKLVKPIKCKVDRLDQQRLHELPKKKY